MNDEKMRKNNQIEKEVIKDGNKKIIDYRCGKAN